MHIDAQCPLVLCIRDTPVSKSITSRERSARAYAAVAPHGNSSPAPTSWSGGGNSYLPDRVFEGRPRRINFLLEAPEKL